MNKEQRMQYGIAGCILLMVLFFVIMPLFTYRTTGLERVQTAQENYTSIQNLANVAELSAKQATLAQDTSLFGRINKEAERLMLASRIETLRPVILQDTNGGERIDLRMTDVYLDQTVAWLFALESYPDIRIESLTLTRTGENLVTMDMVVIRQGIAP